MADAPGIDGFLASLRNAESGGNYTARSSSSTASGAYQYIDSTWNGYGGYAHAWQAPPEVQDRRARQDALRTYAKYKDWDYVAAAHFAGSGWVKAHPDKSTWGQNPVPGSMNPTVARYVQRVTGSDLMTTGTTSSSSGGDVTTPRKIPTDADLLNYVKSNYGYLAAFLSVKELRNVLFNAAKAAASGSPWDNAKLQGAVYATKWWKQTSETTRTWLALRSQDPATYTARLNEARDSIVTFAKSAGVSLTHEQVMDLAEKTNRYGWNQNTLQQAITAHFDYNPAQAPTGQGAVTVESLRSIAKEYLLPLSDATLEKWTKDILSGTLTTDAFRAYMAQQAKSRYPGLGEALDRGVTPAQYGHTYAQIIGQTLEVDPDQVNLMDPKWMRMIDQVDPKTGVHHSMSLADAAEYVKSQPEFRNTRQAHEAAADLGMGLLKTLGRIA